MGALLKPARTRPPTERPLPIGQSDSPTSAAPTPQRHKRVVSTRSRSSEAAGESAPCLGCAPMTALDGGRSSTWRRRTAGDWRRPVARSENRVRLQGVVLRRSDGQLQVADCFVAGYLGPSSANCGPLLAHQAPFERPGSTSSRHRSSARRRRAGRSPSRTLKAFDSEAAIWRVDRLALE